MAERERIQKPSRRKRGESDPEVPETPAAPQEGDRLKGELDDILDEIEEVLETNAEEFVKSYIQKGGQ